MSEEEKNTSSEKTQPPFIPTQLRGEGEKIKDVRENNHPLAPSLEKEGRGTAVDFNAWQLAGELGYTIAIPIVVLALAGRWADNALKTSPWLLLVGILISIMLSSFLVYRKVSKILK